MRLDFKAANVFFLIKQKTYASNKKDKMSGGLNSLSKFLIPDKNKKVLTYSHFNRVLILRKSSCINSKRALKR